MSTEEAIERALEAVIEAVTDYLDGGAELDQVRYVLRELVAGVRLEVLREAHGACSKIFDELHPNRRDNEIAMQISGVLKCEEAIAALIDTEEQRRGR